MLQQKSNKFDKVNVKKESADFEESLNDIDLSTKPEYLVKSTFAKAVIQQEKAIKTDKAKESNFFIKNNSLTNLIPYVII